MSPHELNLAQINAKSDDLDFGDISAYSADMSEKADEFKTIGQQKIEKEEKEKEKKRLA